MRYVETPQSICRFGIARTDITPPVGIYHRMWGAASHEVASGVHRPLLATAMFFQQEDTAASQAGYHVVIAIDHCLLWPREMAVLLNSVSTATELPEERLSVIFSHTHGAGLMGRERQAMPGGDLIPDYLQLLNERVSALVQEARNHARTAAIVYGSGHCGLAAQRDYWDEDRREFVCGYNPAGPVDDTVLVARITDDNAAVLATVVNYACHPTTLAWDNTLISPDFPGAMREVVEAETDAPCVFVQGALGDVGPVEGFVGDVRVADRNGRQLGFAALSALTALPPAGTRFQYDGAVESGAIIGTWSHVPLTENRRARQRNWQCRQSELQLQLRNDLRSRDEVQSQLAHWQAREKAARDAGDERSAQVARAKVERQVRAVNRLDAAPTGTTLNYPMTIWRMGDAIWLAIDGEPYNLLQRRLRQRFADVPIVVATLAGASGVGYLPPAEEYGKGIYQESIATTAPGSLEQVIDAIATQIEGMIAGDDG